MSWEAMVTVTSVGFIAPPIVLGAVRLRTAVLKGDAGASFALHSTTQPTSGRMSRHGWSARPTWAS
eukprot:907993-Amphidinium_carterae.1